jgi:glycosyltransferase involved in cell wall biosynthesis
MVRVMICRSNPVAPDPRVEKEAQSLCNAGYSVQILGWDRSADLPKQEDLGWAVIHRLTIRAGYARGLMNLLPLLRWQLGLLTYLLRRSGEFDILHTCDFDTILPALICKRLRKKRLIYDIFDFYADHLRATPGIVKRLIRAVDIWAIGQADGVILVDDQRCKQIAGAHPKRLAVVYNSPQDALPEKGSVQAEETRIHIAYIGLLQLERGLLDVLEVMRRHPEWKLDLAGFGGDEAQILEKAKGLRNVAWHGRVPYSKALAISAGANVLVGLYDPSIPNHRYASPNKIFEAMMLGKPIIVARNTNMDRIIAEFEAGIVIDYGDVDGLESALLRLDRDPALRTNLGRSARQAYEGHFSWAIMEERLLGMYREVLGA